MKNIEKSKNETVEVLYQKLGDRWFAFSLIEGEVFFGSITPEEIREKEAQEKAKAAIAKAKGKYKEFQ